MCHDCEAGSAFDTTLPQELLYATTVRQEPIVPRLLIKGELFPPRLRSRNCCVLRL